MTREYKIKNVRVEDKLYEDAYVITYAREEGAVFEVLVYPTEEEADEVMNEYIEHGTLTLQRHDLKREQVFKPVVMFKSKVIQSFRKDLKVEKVRENTLPSEVN